jgi:light-regulated signal transduction histidine kinase (bacteriophytochrome)
MTSPHVGQAVLDACAREPIRIPGGIQPHGALLVLDAEKLVVLQSSANCAGFLGTPIEIGSPLAVGGTALLAEELKKWIANQEALFLRTLDIAGQPFQVAAHRSSQGVLVEFEAAPSSASETLEAVYPRLRSFVDAIGAEKDVAGIAQLAVREIRALTGFNRVKLYAFDSHGDGTVIAEDSDGVLPSYLDLRFPASDIPAQARELYRMNRLRIIPNSTYTPVPINPTLSPVDNKPLDMSHAALRSVSPVHLEYMRNMGTGASMSISILVDDTLWGLISCHNRTPANVNPQIRTACDFLGQIISLQIGARERAEAAAYRIRLKRIESQLLAKLSTSTAFHEELREHGDEWRAIVAADGAALITTDALVTVGLTPSHPEITALAGWLHNKGIESTFSTDSLSNQWMPAEDFAESASGLLAISISQIHPSYIMWFRQEMVRTVKWGGDPRKYSELEQLNPRKSFETWKELVRQKSLPWSDVEIESAHDFRTAILNFVLRRAEERAEISGQLQRSNAELEAFSYSVSHDLRAPFRHIAGFGALLAEREKNLDAKSAHYLQQILDTTISAGQLVDNLLNFSHLGRVHMQSAPVDMRKVVNEARRTAEQHAENTRITWTIGDLPPAHGDAALLRQVWTNLIENALKYASGRDEIMIAITGEDQGTVTRYSISDNGVGFDMAYAGKLFGVFQRLHRSEEFPGTGIGLALAKRIIDRHGGSITAEGVVDRGAVFTFSLPKAKRVP